MTPLTILLLSLSTGLISGVIGWMRNPHDPDAFSVWFAWALILTAILLTVATQSPQPVMDGVEFTP